jgi:hypothetical protein
LPGWLIKVDDPKLKLKLFYSAKKGDKCEARKAEAGRISAQITIFVCACAVYRISLPSITDLLFSFNRSSQVPTG